MRTRLSLGLFLFTVFFESPGFALAPAQFPALAAHVDTPGPTSILRATPDHSIAVGVSSEGAWSVSETGFVLDLRVLDTPMIRSTFPIQGRARQLEISPDGKTAMLLVDKEGAGVESRWEIVAMDLSNWKTPVELWRHVISPGLFQKEQVAIASDASAYALSQTAPNEFHSQIVVQKTTGEQSSIAIDTTSYLPRMKFHSRHGLRATSFVRQLGGAPRIWLERNARIV